MIKEEEELIKIRKRQEKHTSVIISYDDKIRTIEKEIKESKSEKSGIRENSLEIINHLKNNNSEELEDLQEQETKN